MTRYNLSEIASFINGKLTGNPELIVTDLSYDSRKLVGPRNALFFALKTHRNDGHDYIPNAYKKGVRAFVVAKGYTSKIDASFIEVEDPMEALQRLSKAHRNTFRKPVLAITGSNGKTTVKEWITLILESQRNVSASPRSFNSQLGVPLSLWEIESTHDIAIIEAGISEVGEMEKLATIISPTCGIFTNIGDAHLQNFKSKEELISEKAKLFSGADWVVINSDQKLLMDEIKKLEIPTVTWGSSANSDVKIHFTSYQKHTLLQIHASDEAHEISIPFIDYASIENVCHALVTCLQLGVDMKSIRKGISMLEPLDMRLQVLKGINNCTLINDSYTVDVKALKNSLNLAHSYSHNRTKTLIISDFSTSDRETYKSIRKIVEEKGVDRLITIGIPKEFAQQITSEAEVYESKQIFLDQNLNQLFKDEVIVIKGARKFQLEGIAHRLQLKDHQTVLEINLNAFTTNLNHYRSKLEPSTKVMAMVKAFSYGSGSYEIAAHLESLGVYYLAVAYTDEGVVLRKHGVQLPILVLNPEPSSFESIIRCNLEPEIYSLELLEKFQKELKAQSQSAYPIHLKLDTGMHRLGIESSEIDTLMSQVIDTKRVEVVTIFSHLAASDDPQFDEFTASQIDLFETNYSKIENALGYKPLKHLCNSSAISRFPEAHFDMVRLGIGLYGISSEEETQRELLLAGRLKSTIIQTRTIPVGDTLGYGRNYVAAKETRIGIIPIGYADGLFRGTGNGQFSVKIGNQTALVIGNVCMDMAFIDITNLNANVGDEVVILDSSEDLKKMASIINTIPYEVLSSISQRVKRTYYTE